MLENPLIFVFPFAVAFAGALDLLTMKIPNWLTLGLAAAFFVVAPFAGLSGQDFLVHLAAGSAMLIAGVFLFSRGWFGGGDAKLFAAAALWLGLEPMPMFIAYVTIFGGVLAVAILAYRQTPAGAYPLPEWALRLHAQGGGMPYGLAIAAGALVIYPTTAWYAAFAS